MLYRDVVATDTNRRPI